MKIILAVAASVLLAACQTTPTEPLKATAELKSTTGNKKLFGEVTFEQIGDKVRVQAIIQGLKPGSEHGFHIHEVGDCSGSGMSAKGHFNPMGKTHGNPASSNRHAGDLPSLKAPLKGNKRGRARINVELDIITLESGAGNIIGRGLVVHALPDDYTPTSNPGARIACGVIKAS